MASSASPQPSREPSARNTTVQRWKRSLGRALDTQGFTVEEWEGTDLVEQRKALRLAAEAVLERLRLQETQAQLLERDTLSEDWNGWLLSRFPDQPALVPDVDVVGIAFAVRWCEILLGRQFEIEQVLSRPPEAIVQWTRDVE